MRQWRPYAGLAGALLLAGCMVGPDYQRPAAPVTPAYKEQGIWKVAQPQDEAPHGAWWSVYDDPLLDKLEHQIDIDNQTIKAAEEAYNDAVAIVQQARASLFPTASTTFSERTSKGSTSAVGTALPTTTGTTTSTAAIPTTTGSSGSSVRSVYSLAATASWAPDVWGAVRRAIAGDVASAQVSAANLAAARLSAQGALATAYLELRIQDELKKLLDESAEAYARSLQIVKNQYGVGVAGKSDVAQAETQLFSTQAQAINTGVLRAQLEHAIAVLIGLPPASFSIEPEPATLSVPGVPAGVPSTLLERRPDIAAAERQMHAANEQIGVAVAAYYPNFTLTTSVSYSGSVLSRLIQDPNQFWSVGPAAAETLLDFGSRDAQVKQARALYNEAVANYRQTVLAGFQQVEDQLAALRILAEQATVQDQAVNSAREAERLIFNQYRAGTVAYTSVVVAQTAALSNAETALTLRENRLTASVALLQALGGGWDTGQMPKPDDIDKFDPHVLLPFPVSDENGKTPADGLKPATAK
jgi:NodT family efflux transporter outer membrane factor (OMF) lipoprotein